METREGCGDERGKMIEEEVRQIHCFHFPPSSSTSSTHSFHILQVLLIRDPLCLQVATETLYQSVSDQHEHIDAHHAKHYQREDLVLDEFGVLGRMGRGGREEGRRGGGEEGGRGGREEGGVS